MKTGIDLIMAERRRQVNEEGFTVAKDQQYEKGELVRAGRCYLQAEINRASGREGIPVDWPWSPDWWKPSPDDRVKELVKAGALFMAEADAHGFSAQGLIHHCSTLINKILNIEVTEETVQKQLKIDLRDPQSLLLYRLLKMFSVQDEICAFLNSEVLASFVRLEFVTITYTDNMKGTFIAEKGENYITTYERLSN